MAPLPEVRIPKASYAHFPPASAFRQDAILTNAVVRRVGANLMPCRHQLLAQLAEQLGSDDALNFMLVADIYYIGCRYLWLAWIMAVC